MRRETRRARLSLLPLLVLFSAFPCSLASAQSARDDLTARGESLDSLTSRAQEAIHRSAFESAVKILSEAKAKYPASPRASLALGDLYYDKQLYSLALEEYRTAEHKGASDFSTLTQISRCYGKLNQESRSIQYLRRILKQYPDSTDTMDDLGWMYFKTHQLDEGEKVLLRGIAKVGPQRGLAMTLGTIYSGMNRYDKSRDFYLKAVDQALRVGDRNFAAIAYYNLSLLEHGFFHFNSALRFTDESLEMEDRPSGHLARGELFQSRMDFGSALQEYQSAYAKDTTPLSKVNLAILYQTFGRLDLARRYGEEALSSHDNAWLVDYGTDLMRHLKDLHELLATVYAGLAEAEITRPTAGIFDRTGAVISSLRDRVLAWYHRERFRAYSLQVGAQYLAQGSYEDAWWEFYRGNEGYPEVALKYLHLARDLETARSPHAAAYYALEEGRLLHSARQLESSLPGFDPYWEKEPSAEALTALVPLLRGRANRDRRWETIDRLYRINPGAMRQAGIGLPLTVRFEGTGWHGITRALILRFLRRTGSDCAGPPGGQRYGLRLLETGSRVVRWELSDPSGSVVRSGTVSPAGGAFRAAAAITRSILEVAYAVH